MIVGGPITPGHCTSPASLLVYSLMKSCACPGVTHSKEDIAGGVKASGIDAGSIGWPAVTEDAAGVAGDGALGRRAFCSPSSRGCVRYHKVYHVLCGAANL